MFLSNARFPKNPKSLCPVQKEKLQARPILVATQIIFKNVEIFSKDTKRISPDRPHRKARLTVVQRHHQKKLKKNPFPHLLPEKDGALEASESHDPSRRASGATRLV